MSFWQAKALIDVVDRLFSKFIRERDGNRCQYCGSTPLDGRGMQCSHFWGRRYESTRFDPLNCDTLCIRCHMKLEDEKEEGRTYWLWKRCCLGPIQFDLLNIRAHSHVKKDRKMSLLYVKALMAELEKGKPEVVGLKS